MGSGSSRSRPRDDGGTRRGLAAFLCGAGAGSAASSSSAAAASVPSQVLIFSLDFFRICWFQLVIGIREKVPGCGLLMLCFS